MVGLVVQAVVVVDLWKKQFLVFLGMIIPSLLKYQRHPFSVMVKQMVVIMQIQKLNVKHSISVPMMEMEDGQSTASSVPMEQFSSSNILCVTGGSMLIALLLSLCTP